MWRIKARAGGLGGRLAFVLCAALLTGGCITQSVGARPSPALTSQSPPMSSAADQSPQPSPTSDAVPLSLASIQRVDARVGFIAAWTGGGPGLAKTTDGGATWQKIKVPTARITDLRFIDADVGWAAGFIPSDLPQVACVQPAPSGSSSCYGVVLRTQDGGATWQKTLLVADDGVNGDPVRQIQAIDGDHAWALTFACTPSSPAVSATNCPTKVLRTIDGGRTWTALITGYIAAFRFATAMRGWLAVENPDGSFNVRVTSDGGNTWATVLRTTSGDVVGLDAADSQTAWVMTQAGGYCTSSTCTNYQLLRTTDGGSTWSTLGNPKPFVGSCFGGHLVGPVFASPMRGWLAENLGAGGAAALTGLLQTEDGGRSWRCSAVPTNTYLVSAADPAHVWVTTSHLGDEATTLFSSEDGGLTWHAVGLSALS